MSPSDIEQEKTLLEKESRIQRQIAFASGIFQGDVTIRTLLESLAEGVVVIDNTGTILLVNSRAGLMFGYAEKELVGKPHSVLIPDRFRKVHEEHEANYFAEPGIRPMGQLLELSGLRSDGSEFPVEISLGFVKTTNGVLVMALVSDMTLRKLYESRLLESEELFHIQVECVKDHAVFVLDAEGNVLNWNAGAERLKGYDEKEIIGKNFSCFYPEEERNAGKPAEMLKKAAVAGQIEDEGWRIRKDGSRFWADVIITALYDENGNLRGFSKVTRDISERKKGEDALRFSEERYRALFRDNPTMIVTLDAEFTMLSVNPICACLLGYTIDELEGRSVLMLFHKDDRLAVVEQLRMCLQNHHQVYRWQFRKIHKDGTPLWVEETAQAVYGLNGALNVLVVCQDITERKRMEDEVKKAKMQFELILASAGEGIVGLDLEGNQTFVNASAAAMLGYEVNELIGKQSHSTWHYARSDGSLYPMEKCPVYAAYKDGTIHSGEELFLRRDGTAFPVNFTSRPIYYDENIAGAVLTFNDITERKRIEAALQESEERFRATFDQAAVGIGHVGPDGRLLRINRKYCDIVGYTEEELKAMTIQEITHPHDLEASMNHFREVLEGKLDSYTLEKRYVRKEGSIVWVNLTVSTVVGTDGKLRFAVGVVEDISARKRADEEIERLNTNLAARAAELEDANRELEAFNYTVAHDLRKPLTVVNGYCQALREFCSDMFDEQCKGYLREAYDGTLRMNRLIDALLTFSRLAHVEPHRETVDLSAMAHQVAAELKLAEPQRKVTFLIADGVSANGDASLLRVVMDNLFGNAWKYTGIREEAVIEFGTGEIDGKPACFVRDNGAGFDNADADKIFKPFQRLPGIEECRGFGIGLATVERIIRRHGGKVWAQGELGKGATFCFTLQAREGGSRNGE